MTLEFGTAKDNSSIKQWMDAPVYPDPRRDWTEEDVYVLDQTFNRGYGKDVLPFPAVSSYAMSFDKNAYNDFTGILLMDPHWTEKDVEDYKELLKNSGYSEETGTIIDGSTATVYRRLLLL